MKGLYAAVDLGATNMRVAHGDETGIKKKLMMTINKSEGARENLEGNIKKRTRKKTKIRHLITIHDSILNCNQSTLRAREDLRGRPCA